ncbi:MAG TPA: shikimate kinase [Mycobacteriales bacterium]|jgi:shikimate kinase|nr:shikimate kinase [Mycobacteriales bacterium]
MTPLVVLVGPPGAGKSTVGRLVADQRGVAFRDTDADVEATSGETISEIFVDRGEDAFRELEREAVRIALTDHEGVLALGGGAVLDPQTRSSLRGHRVVFLDVGLADAAARVGLNRDRPLLLGNPRAQLRTMLADRRPLYLEVASATVETDGREPEAVADAVLAAL